MPSTPPLRKSREYSPCEFSVRRLHDIGKSGNEYAVTLACGVEIKNVPSPTLSRQRQAAVVTMHTSL